MLDLGKECQGALSIGITGHTNPDGDCIGTTLALWQFLKKLKPECRIDVILEKPAPEYDFIQGIDFIHISRLSGYNENRTIRPLSEPLDQTNPIHIGKLGIHQNQIRADTGAHLHAGASAGGSIKPIVLPLQHPADQIKNTFILINQQNLYSVAYLVFIVH